jgi:hypothetical protein
MAAGGCGSGVVVVAVGAGDAGGPLWEAGPLEPAEQAVNIAEPAKQMTVANLVAAVAARLG